MMSEAMRSINITTRKNERTLKVSPIILGNTMNPIICKARPEDRPFIEEIAKLTWDGEDYLAGVFDEWLGDNFYVLELDGKVSARRSSRFYPEMLLA